MTDFIQMTPGSNRVKALIVAFVMALFAKYLPDYVPDEATMNWLYGSILTFILGDTVRPIDPNKPGLLG